MESPLKWLVPGNTSRLTRRTFLNRALASGGMAASAALLPPPTPFKIFVFAAGVFELPLTSFAGAIGLARVLRYFGIGYLAIRYGEGALPFLAAHKWQVAEETGQADTRPRQAQHGRRDARERACADRVQGQPVEVEGA